MFDINKFKNINSKDSRYKKRIDTLLSQKKYIDSIESAVNSAADNIVEHKSKSFVIYGEPQSGKTEMMIALSAKLLDIGFKVIIVLLNDNVQLLNQNLERFKRSGLDPSPKNFNEILDPSVNIREGEWVIFCKKNTKDLQKLISRLHGIKEKVIIDDEADYATPNSRINKGEITKINELVGVLLSDDGVYIGVTATPGRLDLNNTFNNRNDKWIDFPIHPDYTGQDIFFPVKYSDIKELKYNLYLLPDEDDNPKYLREALFLFFINVGFLNKDAFRSQNYSMLIHTSGKKADHTADYKQVVKVFDILKDENSRNYENYVHRIWELSENRYPGQADNITKFILENIQQNSIVVMNSDVDKNAIDYNSATNPATLFTIAIGGNIVSRGVTFNNLLSMFFTRDVKHKIQQDTYIQRARMFGSRGDYLNKFDLHIPGKLYVDWQRCFVFHRLALSAIKSDKGAPVWLEDFRVSAVASSSIDKSTVDMNSGEMSFPMFNYRSEIENIINGGSVNNYQKLLKLSESIGDDNLPTYLLNFIDAYMPNGDNSIAIHGTREAGDKFSETLERPRGVFGGDDYKKFPEAYHHLLIYKNNRNEARIIYSYLGSIKTLKNRSVIK